MANDFPQRGPQHVLGDKGVLAVSKLLPENWITEEVVQDYGLDMRVEVVDGRNVTGTTFSIQIKGKEKNSAESKGIISVKGVKKSTINYWKRRPERIMLAIYWAEKDLVLWRWTDDIEVPDTDKTTISIPLVNTLKDIEWNSFKKELNKYYERQYRTNRFELKTMKKSDRPSLGSSSGKKAAVKFDSECAIEIFNEATVIQFGDKIGIIDCGRETVDEVVAWLERHEVKELEFIAVSHLHVDHYDGFRKILSVMENVKNVFLPAIAHSRFPMRNFHPPSAFVILMGDIASKGYEVYFFSRHNWILPLGKNKDNLEVRLQICFPAESLKNLQGRNSRFLNQNDICAVFRLQRGKTSFLIPGDANQIVWNELLTHVGEDLRSNGILLPHNGSFSSISKKILGKILYHGSYPAVYQPGDKRFPRFKLPRPETLELVSDHGGVLINVQKRPVRIALLEDRLELQ